MHNELTKIDIEQMEKEIEMRQDLVPALREEVKRTRAFGDLSENDEYRSAKREYNKNNSRMRYLRNMIKTAKIITIDSAPDEVGLFDNIHLLYPDTGEEEDVRIVTTLRNDVFTNNISKESPFGKALLGHKAGDVVTVHIDEKRSYEVKIVSFTKGEDDPDLPISTY